MWRLAAQQTRRQATSCSVLLVLATFSRAALQQNGAGTGTVVYLNKDKYEGDWLNGKRQGVGALWLHDNDRYRIRYTGEWQKDKFHVGFKLLILQPVHLSDLELFLVIALGPWLNQPQFNGCVHFHLLSAMQGRGIYYDDSGSAYEGLWAKGLRQGHGQQAYAPEGGDGFHTDVFDGEWDQDNRSDNLVHLG